MSKFSAIASQLPFEQLMTDLRSAGIPIGIQDFCDAQEALQYGLAGDSIKKLRNLIRMLWMTSVDDFDTFDHHFDRYIAAIQVPISPKEETPRSKGLGLEGGVRGVDPAFSTSSEDESAETPAALPPSASENITEDASITLREGKDKNGHVHPGIIRQHDPVKPLELRRSWQKLVVEGKVFSHMDLDLKATVREIARKGFFDGPVLKPRTQRALNVVILFDREGSMAPVHDFCDRWRDTLLRNVSMRNHAQAYFHNCPTHSIYLDPQLHDQRPIARFLKPFAPNQTAVLVVTDAGAARQSWNTKRIIRCQRLSQKLRQMGFQQLWLNPLGKDYWENNSAQKIASLVPKMLPMDAHGTRRTIHFLNQRFRRLNG